MNSQIEGWRVNAFAANVYQLSQQKGSRMVPTVRKEVFVGKSEFFDRLGLAVAQDKVGRNADTPNLNIDHSRRRVTTVTREWATITDRKDKLQNIHSPVGEYSVAAQNALGRKMDDVLIAGALGTTYAGEEGATAIVLPNTQKITAVASSALTYANVQLLRKAKRNLDEAEAVGTRYILHKADFLESLLSQTEVTSADYNTVKALVQGQLDTFLGFTFIHSERLPLANVYDGSTYKFDTTTGLYSASGTALGGTEKSAIAYVGDGLIFGMNEGMVARISERDDKSYNMQVYASVDCGAARLEDEKVIQLIYKA